MGSKCFFFIRVWRNLTTQECVESVWRVLDRKKKNLFLLVLTVFERFFMDLDPEFWSIRIWIQGKKSDPDPGFY